MNYQTIKKAVDKNKTVVATRHIDAYYFSIDSKEYKVSSKTYQKVVSEIPHKEIKCPKWGWAVVFC